MSVFKKRLEKAFSHEIRNEFTLSISKSYIAALEASTDFGSFGHFAYPILRHYYCDHFIHRMAKKNNLYSSVELNEAKNHKYLCIQSQNLSLTTHHLSKNSSLPRKAKYRSVYCSLNEDLFDNHGDLSLDCSYVYLLHEGYKAPDKIFFAFPSMHNNQILYSEPLDLHSSENFVHEEEIEDEVSDKIKIITEQHIERKTGSK